MISHTVLCTASGGLLSQMGGQMDEAFLRILTEDHGEVLREGEFGDMNVKIEDRIITGSLRHYTGSSEEERERVVQTFTKFAMFPEDVPIPAALFDALAASVFGGHGKRPGLKLRAALSTLVRLSLLQGSLSQGLFQHDVSSLPTSSGPLNA